MQRIALVVDDSRVARMTLKKLLREYQFDVVELGSGEEAIDYLQAENARPDIIFMDVMMGGMDGLTATQKIKELPSVKDIPVIICTGNNTAEDKNKAVNVGAVTALTKPPVAEALAAVIAQIEQREATVEQAPVEAVPQFNEAKMTATILMAVEKQFLPKIQQNTRETAEEISQQVAGEITEKLVEEQINAHMKQALVGLTADIRTKTDSIVEKTAQQICTIVAQECAVDAAEKAVQDLIDEADITTQVTHFLAEKGEEWLEHQEDDLGSQLSDQLERLIPAKCTEYLEANLATLVQDSMSIAVKDSEPEIGNTGLERNEIEEMINLSLHQHTNTVVNPIVNSMVTKQLAAQTLLEQDEEAIDSLTEQVATLKNITVGLGVLVVGLLIAIIV